MPMPNLMWQGDEALEEDLRALSELLLAWSGPVGSEVHQMVVCEGWGPGLDRGTASKTSHGT
jgi:hypothetical protein